MNNTIRKRKSAFVFLILICCLSVDRAQAQDLKEKASEAARAEFFDSAKVHQMHLEISASEWDAMQEVVSRSTPRQDAAQPSDTQRVETRPYHKGKFPWAIAAVTSEIRS